MELHIKPGKYLVGVSGGIDSMVLLDVLSQKPGLELVVAHFDHGIRPDSAVDRVFVAQKAAEYGLPFEYDTAQLGPRASEQQARTARYRFLRQAKELHGAQAIITAHHQDDLIETMIINLLRGTGRKGLSSLQSTPEVTRPLLHVPKKTIQAYAREHGITWREDSTNQDMRYLRNYIRASLVPKMSFDDRQQWLILNQRVTTLNNEIDHELQTLTDALLTQDGLNRRRFILLPHAISKELMTGWLRQNQAHEIDRKQIERLVIAAKTGRVGATYDIDKRKIMQICRNFIKITPRDARKTSI